MGLLLWEKSKQKGTTELKWASFTRQGEKKKM